MTTASGVLVRLLAVAVVTTATSPLDVERGSTNSAAAPAWLVVDGLCSNLVLQSFSQLLNGSGNGTCSRQSGEVLDGIERGELWAWKMLDASSKWPAGLLLGGNRKLLGDYDECLRVEHVTSGSGALFGQHCMAHLVPRRLHQAPGPEPDAWSLCVPATCDPGEIARALEAAWLPSNASFVVQRISCHSRLDETVLTAGDWTAVSIMTLFGVLVIGSTAYDVISVNSKGRRGLFTAFSLYSNGRILLTQGSDPMPALHGVRVLNRFWDNLGQKLSKPMLTPAVNADVLDQYYSEWSHVFITNFGPSIDSIFMLSGILVAYNFMKERDRGTPFNLPVFYFRRYIRFTPPFAAMILLTATIFPLLGDGPLWDDATGPARKNCQDNWWVGLVYFSNYINTDRMCIPQSWYLGVDMQMVWLCPILLYTLARWPHYGKALFGVLVSIGVVVGFYVPYVYHLPVGVPGLGAEGDAGPFQFFPLHTRFLPWLVGAGLGYLLYRAELEPPILSRVFLTFGWVVSVCLMLSACLLAHPFQQPGHEYDRLLESLYTSFMRPAWAFGLAWLIFACVTGHGGWLNSFLSWGFFRVLSRGMYCFYLSHVTVMQLLAASTRAPQYIQDSEMVARFLGGFVVSVCVAFLLSLVFELPAVFLEQHLFRQVAATVNKPGLELKVEEK